MLTLKNVPNCTAEVWPRLGLYKKSWVAYHEKVSITKIRLYDQRIMLIFGTDLIFWFIPSVLDQS